MATVSRQTRAVSGCGSPVVDSITENGQSRAGKLFSVPEMKQQQLVQVLQQGCWTESPGLSNQ